MEGLSLSNLPHYTVGGGVHIVVNNSIGGDYPEDVARAVEFAFKYRNYFRKDIIIDLIVYRRCWTNLHSRSH
ncbi:hypothetical protein A0H81_14442 [Grifola frondosa]|uniref:Uncharacterized protein n=1 Tax=Grifola frondosa TaxID=5627 RepID=A0A1C7LNF3_GRIFR|nr:hypothetical protein A0H81_14442 [Grifola frondosa]